MQSIENWHVQLIRLTAFTSTERAMDGQFGWESVVGKPPDQVLRQPKVASLDETGEFGKGVLSYKVFPGRIDWIYHASVHTLPEGIPEIGTLPEVLDEFKPLMMKWLEKCGGIKRLAFAPSLFLPTEGHEAAYNLLNEYLEFVNVDPKSSDFNYQINRKRQSKALEKVPINRLSNWKALKVNIKINEIDVQEAFACSLNLDINNVPDEKLEIKGESLLKLFNEFIELGVEIVTKGDIL